MNRSDLHLAGRPVTVVDGYLSDRVFLITRWDSETHLSPRETLVLARTLLFAGLRAAFRSFRTS